MKHSDEISSSKLDEEKSQEEGHGSANDNVPEPEGLQGMALAVVMTSICLCMFLVSLVSFACPFSYPLRL